jgi:hypothetical protein
MHYQYYNSNALLIVTPKGKIRILYTPFRVKCVSNECGIKYGVWIYVDEILFNAKDELFYIFNSNAYLYKCFEIYVRF